MKKNITAIFVIGIFALAALASSCSFTTANISKLEFGKSETAQPAMTTFNVGERIFAVATVSNTSSKHKVNFKVTYEDVPGRTKGEEAMNQSMDFEGARPVWLSFAVPAAGEYAVEATLLDDTDKKIDSKSGKITAKGSSLPQATAPNDGDKKSDAKKEDDDH